MNTDTLVEGLECVKTCLSSSRNFSPPAPFHTRFSQHIVRDDIRKSRLQGARLLVRDSAQRCFGAVLELVFWVRQIMLSHSPFARPAAHLTACQLLLSTAHVANC